MASKKNDELKKKILLSVILLALVHFLLYTSFYLAHKMKGIKTWDGVDAGLYGFFFFIATIITVVGVFKGEEFN